MTSGKSEEGGMMLLFALLDMLDISDEPAMAEAIAKLKGLVHQMDPITSYNVLRLKIRALLKVRDDLLLRLGTSVVPSAVDDVKVADRADGEKDRREHPLKVQVPINDFLDRLIDLLEDTSNSSDDYSESLEKGLRGFNDSKKIKEIRQLTEHLVGTSTDMRDATQMFQAGIAEMATMMFDFQRKVQELETELEEQKEIAMIDKLTGVHNRRAFDMRLEELVAQSRRFHTPMCLFLLDMDHFKEINDNYGHQVGDVVLTSFARLLRTSCREYDMVFRFGGDEFAVIFPNEGISEGKIFANRIQEFMQNNCYRYKDAKINMSVSGGMAQLKEEDDGHSLFKRADKRLYQAKNGGRGRFSFD